MECARRQNDEYQPLKIYCVMCMFFLTYACMQGRIQLFIDALDSDVRSGEIDVIINRFPIDLAMSLKLEWLSLREQRTRCL